MRYVFMMGVLGLAACSAGIKDDGSNAITKRFTADTTYQEAYRRADDFARKCHTSRNIWAGSFDVDGNLYTDNKTGVVHVRLSGHGTDTMKISVADHNGGASVDISMWDKGLWDQQELKAAQSSIESGRIACRGDTEPRRTPRANR